MRFAIPELLPPELGELYWTRCGGVHNYECYSAPECLPKKVVLCSSPLSGQIKEQFKKCCATR